MKTLNTSPENCKNSPLNHIIEKSLKLMTWKMPIQLVNENFLAKKLFIRTWSVAFFNSIILIFIIITEFSKQITLYPCQRNVQNIAYLISTLVSCLKCFKYVQTLSLPDPTMNIDHPWYKVRYNKFISK